MVCSLNRSSFGKLAVGLSSPLIIRKSISCRVAHCAIFVWKPLRALISGAKISHRAAFGQLLHGHGDGRKRLAFHRDVAVRAMLCAELGKQQAEKMINLRHRRHGGFAAAAGHPLLDGHAGRQALDRIHIGLLQLLDELPRIRRHAVEKATLPLGKKDVEGEGGFARAAQARHHHHLFPRDLHGDVLEIVFARPDHADEVVLGFCTRAFRGVSARRERLPSSRA